MDNRTDFNSVFFTPYVKPFEMDNKTDFDRVCKFLPDLKSQTEDGNFEDLYFYAFFFFCLTLVIQMLSYDIQQNFWKWIKLITLDDTGSRIGNKYSKLLRPSSRLPISKSEADLLQKSGSSLGSSILDSDSSLLLTKSEVDLLRKSGFGLGSSFNSDSSFSLSKSESDLSFGSSLFQSGSSLLLTKSEEDLLLLNSSFGSTLSLSKSEIDALQKSGLNISSSLFESSSSSSLSSILATSTSEAALSQKSNSGSDSSLFKSVSSLSMSKSEADLSLLESRSSSSLKSTWSSLSNETEVSSDNYLNEDPFMSSLTIKLSTTGFLGVSSEDYFRLKSPSTANWRFNYNLRNVPIYRTLKDQLPQKIIEFETQSSLYDETYYDDLFLNETDSDFSISIDSFKFPIHKDVLMNKCPKLLYELVQRDGVYPFPKETFEELLRFIYCGRIQRVDQHVPELLWAAHFHYKYKALKKYCEKELARLIKIENAYAMYNLVKETEASIEIEMSLRVRSVK